MQRHQFIKNILSASALISIGGVSAFGTACNTMTTSNIPQEKLTFGEIHLQNTSLKAATHFWTNVMGMKNRKTLDTQIEFGTENNTLVVVHETAKHGFQEGFSGLYHFAIHTPNASEFARMVQRLIEQKIPFSPIDHTMSKSIYLIDPDGIEVEIALETPERFAELITDGSLRMKGTDGTIRAATAPLNVQSVLSELKDSDTKKINHADTVIGHFHFYATEVDAMNRFYLNLGFEQFNLLPQYLYADVGAGGFYKHRIAMNSWHGLNKPIAPLDAAGMLHYSILFQTKESLNAALTKHPEAVQKENGYWIVDPSGNHILLRTKE